MMLPQKSENETLKVKNLDRMNCHD